jgi:hypothetical protein
MFKKIIFKKEHRPYSITIMGCVTCHLQAYFISKYLFFYPCSVIEVSHNATKGPITGMCLSPSRICAVRKLEWGSEFATSPRKMAHNFSCGVSEDAIDGGNKSVLLDTQEVIALTSHGLNSREHWIKLGKGSFGTVIQAKYKG